jgi:N-sulfoglucosamine sulfohydrolase
MFLSDHGMPLPFAKTQLYHHSTHTPLMVRWPGVTKAGSEDTHHMVSAVDFLPTLLDVMGHEHPTPERLHGHSFAPLIRGEAQADRDFVILQYNENSGRNRHPMRGIHTREYLYLYNPWSDGVRKFATATTGTMTYRQMVKRAEKETDIATRLRLFDHRVVEELYDIKNDPDCLVNLMGHDDHQAALGKLRSQLAQSLTDINDPVAPLVAAVEDESLRNAYMAKEDERSQNRKKARQQKKNKQLNSNATQRRLKDVIQVKDVIKVDVPKSVSKGQKCSVVIHHKIPEALASQSLTVTLKSASMDPESKINTRIDREVVKIEGTGEIRIEFNVPDDLTSGAVRVAAWVGDAFETNLQYLNSGPIPVEGHVE